MPLIFPMTWESCGKTLPIAECHWSITRREEVRFAGDGRPYTRELADPRWTAQVRLGWMDHNEHARIQALLERHGSGRPLWLHDPKQPGPAEDRAGATLGAAVPLLHAVTSTTLRIKALPSGYKLSVGDRIGVLHPTASQPALYRVEEAATAAGTGITPEFTVSPPPRAEAAVNDPVTLLSARTLMLILPGSLQRGQRRGHGIEGVAFDAVEAL